MKTNKKQKKKCIKTAEFKGETGSKNLTTSWGVKTPPNCGIAALRHAVGMGNANRFNDLSRAVHVTAQKKVERRGYRQAPSQHSWAFCHSISVISIEHQTSPPYGAGSHSNRVMDLT